jgi:hypothetical protein
LWGKSTEIRPEKLFKRASFGKGHTL